MTVIAMEGFEHGDSSNLVNPVSMSDGSMSISYGRLGGRGCRLSSGDSFDILIPNNTYSTVVIGCALHFITLGSYSSAPGNPSYSILNVYDSNSNIVIGVQFCSNDGVVKVIRRTGSVTYEWVGTDSFLFTLNNWYYMELKIVVHDTTGLIEFKINENTIVNETGLDTLYDGSYISKFSLNSSGNTHNLDDIYIDDADFLGDVRIKGFTPDSDGAHSDFTRNTGSNDYECVDEVPSTDDTDYIEADTVGNKSTFGITTGSLSTVKGIRVLNQVRKTDAGSRQARAIVRSNGTDYNGTTVNLFDNYSGECQYIWETDPDDSNAWDQTKLEAAEFGLEIVT